MNQYNTDTINLTCSCEDWKQTRKDYPQYDPRRLCKHIINYREVYEYQMKIHNSRLPIKNIIIGSRVLDSDKVIQNIKEKCIEYDYENINVEKSNLPYQ